MQEMWVQFLGEEDPLEEEMATHSGILAWRIPWTEETGWLQSMGSQRVRHNWATEHACIISIREKMRELLNFKVSKVAGAISSIFCLNMLHPILCFPVRSGGKESTCNVGDLGSILGLGRSRGGGHGNPLLYPCLENPHRQRSLAGYSSWDHKESDAI